MKLISHRGNLTGPNPDRENDPDYILAALDAGYEVEIDVHVVDREFWLGHDTPQYKVNGKFLTDSRLWCHAKTLGALNMMLDMKDVHCFWHQDDDTTLTSRGYMWTYPGKPLCDNSICVLPERGQYEYPLTYYKCKGICSDYITDYKRYK